jgi:hypothetical protein
MLMNAKIAEILVLNFAIIRNTFLFVIVADNISWLKGMKLR